MTIRIGTALSGFWMKRRVSGFVGRVSEATGSPKCRGSPMRSGMW